MNELHLFAGAGGGILGGKLLGHRCVCAVEKEQYAQEVLIARQNDGTFEPFPIWDDVCTFDGTVWKGLVDVVCGGFPCQDISAAGKGAGITGARSGLWKEFARIIGEVEPKYVFIENSPRLVKLGLEVVLQDLASMGFDAEWSCVSAGGIGANHVRDRIWILAANTNMPQREGRELSSREKQKNTTLGNSCWWKDSSRVHRVDDGVANRTHRLRAIGNGQVPLVAATAFKLLMNRLEK